MRQINILIVSNNGTPLQPSIENKKRKLSKDTDA